MKFDEVKDLSLGELKKKRSGLTEELFNARIKNSIGQLTSPLAIKKIRRDIARLNTAITASAKKN